MKLVSWSKFKRFLLFGGIVLALLFASLFIWLRQDERPLDYSSMDVEVGPADPTLNGYTLIRQFSQDYEDSLPDDFYEIFEAKRNEWDAARYRSILEDHQELVDVFGEALKMPVFLNDQLMRPETLITEVSDFRNYTILKIMDARLDQLGGHDELALSKLLDLDHQISTFCRAEGSLISFLSAVALVGTTQSELADFLEVASIPTSSLIRAASTYGRNRNFASAAKVALKQEFHFFSYCVDMIDRNPAFGAELNGNEVNISSKVQLRLSYGIAFNKNRTRNQILKAYEEIVREADKPANDREYLIVDGLTKDIGPSSLLSRNFIGRQLISILLPAVSGIEEKVTLIEATSTATQLSFALKAYHQENGTLPDSLNELMPDYIDELPLDPYDGKMMRYSKNKKIIYSIGNDSIDNEGSHLPFEFTLNDEEYCEESAERDETEPTFSLRFATE